jgi:hypothetical protein
MIKEIINEIKFRLSHNLSDFVDWITTMVFISIIILLGIPIVVLLVKYLEWLCMIFF